MVIYSSMEFGIALSALMICLTDLIFTLMDGHVVKPQNRMYITILLLLAISAVCELLNISFALDSSMSDREYFFARLTKYVYFLAHSLIAPALYYYISYVVGRSVGLGIHHRFGSTRAGFVFEMIPPLAVVLNQCIIAVNPLTEWCWYFDSDQNFHRNWGEYVFIYGISGLWMVAAFILVMISWNILSKGRKRSIAICFFLACVGIGVQLFSKSYRIEVLMECLGFTGVLLFIENEDDRRNVDLDTYNPAAFSLDLKATIRNHIPVQVLIIRSIRFNKTANTVVSGKIHRDSISQAVAAYLGTVVKRYYIYSIAHGRFALTLYNTSDEEARNIAKEINQRFQNPWNIEGADIFLSSRILIVGVPQRAKTIEEILYISECPIPEHMQEQIIMDNALDWMIRRSSVEEAVMQGIENNNYEVYYQPTYNIDKTLHGAEALLRLNSDKMGMIYPDEFIPIAEQLGVIDLLDEFVLKEVCKFILTGIPQKNGMECINVNLSVLECMKEGFAEYISGIVENAGVRKKMINFEITESVAAKDYEHLANVIDQLKQEGFRFSIDDYGTGYSNMTSLFSLGAEIIKIDKSILWNSGKSELGMTLLKTSIEMVHKMQKKALMEGVETESHIRTLKELGCDYLQGYYFSKPLPKDKFIELIEKK